MELSPANNLDVIFLVLSIKGDGDTGIKVECAALNVKFEGPLGDKQIHIDFDSVLQAASERPQRNTGYGSSDRECPVSEIDVAGHLGRGER